MASKYTLRTLDLDTQVLGWKSNPYPALQSILPVVSSSLQILHLTSNMALKGILAVLPSLTSLHTLTLKAPLLSVIDLHMTTSAPNKDIQRISNTFLTNLCAATESLEHYAPPRVRVRDPFGAITSFETLPIPRITFDNPKDSTQHLEYYGPYLDTLVEELASRQVRDDGFRRPARFGMYDLVQVVRWASLSKVRGCELIQVLFIAEKLTPWFVLCRDVRLRGGELVRRGWTSLAALLVSRRVKIH